MSKCTYVTEERLLDFAIEASDGLLPNDIYCNTTVGGIKAGTTIPKGTSYGTIFQMLLTTYQAPVLSISLTPSTTLYEKGVDSVTGLKVLAQVTKKTNPISSIQWYINNSLVDELTSADGISNGGNYTYSHNATISNDVTIKVVVTDSENKTVTKEIPIKFVGMSYYGILDKNMTSPTETDIIGMNKILKDTKTFVYSNITTSMGKICYAYPKIFGALTSIKDKTINIDYSNGTFNLLEMTINGLEYYVYFKAVASSASGVELTFE